jgi:ribonuclease P protein component
MNRKYSLKKNHEIEALVKSKQSVGNKHYAIYYRKDPTIQTPKIAISASKKLGKAIIRNYEKRVTREIIRLNLEKFQGFVCLVVIKIPSQGLSFEEKKQQLEFLMHKMIIKEKSNESSVT